MAHPQHGNTFGFPTLWAMNSSYFFQITSLASENTCSVPINIRSHFSQWISVLDAERLPLAWFHLTYFNLSHNLQPLKCMVSSAGK